MSETSLSVIIPSRVQPQQAGFLRRAVASIRNQTAISGVSLKILVGIDAGAQPESTLAEALGIQFVESTGRSQAAALNAGIACTDTDLVAFLEDDDDEWQTTYLATALQQIAHVDFVSSTQLEFDEHGVVLRINDFPTPSGWLMTRARLHAVGMFDESYRFHLDNEWLGRLGETGAQRVHMVEATAPQELRFLKQIRPWLAGTVALSGNRVRLARHGSPYPLVNRLVHSGSGMAQIAASADLTAISMSEQQRLKARFGRIPW